MLTKCPYFIVQQMSVEIKSDFHLLFPLFHRFYHLVIRQFNVFYGELEEERVKEAYWICFAFMVYEDMYKQKPFSVHDNQEVTSRLNEHLWTNIAMMSIGSIRCIGCNGAV